MTIKGSLTGVRILDLTVAHAGPYGAQLLGDLGAEVIKIEPPKFGDLIRHGAPFLGDAADLMNPYSLALFRNRKSVALDMGTKSGKQAFYDLVKVSDVVFSQQRAAVAKRLGTDHETLIQINPRIISCVLTGFGSSGPYVNRPSYDDIAQGVSGMASLCGEKGGKPIRAPVAIVDILTGAEAALGIASCLYEVKSSGKGKKIEISLLDTALSAMDTHFALYWLTGKTPEPQGSRHPASPLLGSFKTKDGYIIIGPSWPRICRAINREWMIDDPRFSTPTSRFENREAMENLIEEALQEQTTETWVAILQTEDIAFAPINTLDKVVLDPQVVHNKSIITLKHPKYGEFKAIDNAIKVQGTEGEHIPPPLIGEHTEEVLKGILGYSDDKIKSLNGEAEKHSAELKSHVQRVL
jgi:Predicted acyl-CoA transferases/carnitine dehydratase